MARWEWLIMEVIVVVVLAWELRSVKRSIAADKAKKDKEDSSFL